MNQKKFLMLAIVSICFLFFSGSDVLGQSVKLIQLRDGTVLRGDIIEMQNRVYTVKTMTLGELKIPEDQILSIKSIELPNKPPVPQIIEGRPQCQHKSVVPSIASESGILTANEKVQTSVQSSQPDYKKVQSEVNTRVRSMMMDQNFSEKIMNLHECPEMQDVLNDEETMNAIQSGDYESLMNNEKIHKLMNSSQIKELLGDIEK